MLDGTLLDDLATRRLYVDAIDLAAPHRLGPEVRFRDPGRWDALRARLASYGVPRTYESPRFVAERLVAILAARPRLAVAPDALDAMTEELTRAARRLDPARLLTETRAALTDEGREGPSAH